MTTSYIFLHFGTLHRKTKYIYTKVSEVNVWLTELYDNISIHKNVRISCHIKYK